MQIKDFYGEYLVYHRAIGKSPKTLAEHKRMLGIIEPYVGEKTPDQLHINDLYLVRQAGLGHGEHGAQRCVLVFRMLLKYIQKQGYHLKLDINDISLPPTSHKPVEYLTREKLDIVRNCFDTNTLPGLRHRALIELLVSSLMRISEACSLNREDINWDEREITVQNAKTKNWEKVYFNERAEYWLRRYLQERKDDLPCLFVSGRGRMLEKSSKQYLREKTRHLPYRVYHHIFRKTGITYMIEGVENQSGMNIKAVQTVARHASERTTLRYYAGVNQKKAKAEHQRLMNKI